MNRTKRKRLREAGWKVGSAEEFLRLRRRDLLARWFVQRVRLSDMMGVRMPSGMGVAWVDPLSARMVIARIPLNFLLAAARDAWYAIGRFLRRDASVMSRRERAVWDKAHEEGRKSGRNAAYLQIYDEALRTMTPQERAKAMAYLQIYDEALRTMMPQERAKAMMEGAWPEDRMMDAPSGARGSTITEKPA